jgi:UDP-glucose 4-epimerase
MRILVTGGAGFIASHVTEAYIAAGHEVHVVDNLATGHRENVPAGAEFHQADILSGEFEELVARLKPEVVNHHAAQASVKLSASNPLGDLDANARGTARVAEFAAANGVRKLIYASTGGALYGDPEYVPVDEGHPIRPISAYGLSKYMGELWIGLVGRTKGLDYTILRYANAYGPRQDPHGEAGVVAIFTGKLLAGEQCTIDGDGEQMKDYVYVGDLARANLLALELGSRRALNIGTCSGTSVNAIFATLRDSVGSEATALHGPPRPGDVRNIWLESSLAAGVLGWKPEVSFADGMRATVEAARE